MKVVQASLSVRKDLESSFHHCGSPVKLVQAFVCAEKTYDLRVGAVKHVQACLSFRKDLESIFYPPWTSCVQACLNAGKV